MRYLRVCELRERRKEGVPENKLRWPPLFPGLGGPHVLRHACTKYLHQGLGPRRHPK